MKLIEKTVADFLDAIRAPAPAPGGGSASALAGALGASLLTMIAALPRHRAGSEEDAARLTASGARCREISGQLASLIDADSDAYEGVIAAYRLPKASEDEKSARSARIQEALVSAVETPLGIMRRSVEAIDDAAVVAAFGNANAASDVGVALELLSAAVRGGKLNVEINLSSIKDAAYADRTRQQVGTLIAACERGAAAARTRLAISS
jgi:formiminotetrahydrofolate cyclodeaminase